MLEKEILIRHARTQDIETLAALLEELFQIEKDFIPDAAHQRSGLYKLLEEAQAVILVAESRGEVIGMCTVQTVISTAEGGLAGILEDMIVAASARRQGIARALVKAAEEWAQERGLTRLQLLAESENETALRCYSSTGWHKTGLICLRKMLA
jgi:ribosomal protein S18 acetylase RimI-like enzyme